jgi:phosphoglycerate kinase
MPKMTLEDVSLQGQRVLMRVDFNVPLKGGKVANDGRIRAALPSIRYILENGGRLILMSHLGRPKGERKAEFSLKPCADSLSGSSGKRLPSLPIVWEKRPSKRPENLQDGRVLLLENLRYHKGEEKNDPDFAKELGRLGDLFVNDAFGTAHRAHASTEGVTHFVQPCLAGYLMMKELEYLGTVMEAPQKPFVAILGGAKISGKIDVIQNLLPQVDRLLIGGGMAFTFLHAMGKAVGRSLLEEDRIPLAKQLLDAAKDKIVLPVDCLVSDNFDISAGTAESLQTVGVDDIPQTASGLDIGPATIEIFRSVLENARTVVWNGPMGVFEIPETAHGTFEIARLLSGLTEKGAVTVIGGGDSAAAAENGRRSRAHISYFHRRRCIA